MRPSRMRGAGLLAAVAAVVALAAAPARADTVTEWNVHATTALSTANQPPTVSTLHLAMVHGAVYDAVNAIDREYEPYLVRPRARWWYSKEAAAATAAYRVLLTASPSPSTRRSPDTMPRRWRRSPRVVRRTAGSPWARPPRRR
jgi:hypothetical protein